MGPIARNTIIYGVLSMSTFHIASAMIAESLGFMLIMAIAVTVAGCAITGIITHLLADQEDNVKLVVKENKTLVQKHILTTEQEYSDIHFSYRANDVTVHIVLRSKWMWNGTKKTWERRFELLNSCNPHEVSSSTCDTYHSGIILSCESTDENTSLWRSASTDSTQVALYVSKRQDVQTLRDVFVWQFRHGDKSVSNFMPLTAHSTQTYCDQGLAYYE